MKKLLSFNFVAVFLLAGFGLVTTFQNCSPTTFNSTSASERINSLTLNGPPCDFYSVVVRVEIAYANSHCEKDRAGVWTGSNFCEYSSISSGVGRCQCKTDGIMGSDGKCYMTAIHRQAEVRAYSTYGGSGTKPSAPRACSPYNPDPC